MRLVLSEEAYAELDWMFEYNGPCGRAVPILRETTFPFGTVVQRSNVFPSTKPCDVCGGTGEGGCEATYCSHCAGAGATKSIGVVIDGDRICVITGTLPKRFEPYFPAGLVKPPALCRGLP